MSQSNRNSGPAEDTHSTGYRFSAAEIKRLRAFSAAVGDNAADLCGTNWFCLERAEHGLTIAGAAATLILNAIGAWEATQ